MELYPEARDSGLSRVIGTEANQERLFNEFKEIFENQAMLDKEALKTPEELEMLEQVFIRMPEFVAEYGASSYVPLTSEHFHFFDLENMSADERKKYQESELGSHNAARQNVIILKRGGPVSQVSDMHTTVHEALHFNSFHSKTASEDGFSPRRSGLSIVSGGAGDKMYEPEMRYFAMLNEGVTEELARRFVTKYTAEITVLKEYCDANNVDLENLVAHVEEATKTSVYASERADLWEICTMLAKDAPTKFASPEAAFRLFAKGYFTGRLLDIARAIDKSQGEGTFKKLAYGLAEFEQSW